VADLSGIQASLAKAISPTFEIVFAGAFSAGKSMLINALLEPIPSPKLGGQG
jgi:GTP-binding protein EngB required for normal cell division